MIRVGVQRRRERLPRGVGVADLRERLAPGDFQRDALFRIVRQLDAALEQRGQLLAFLVLHVQSAQPREGVGVSEVDFGDGLQRSAAASVVANRVQPQPTRVVPGVGPMGRDLAARGQRLQGFRCALGVSECLERFGLPRQRHQVVGHELDRAVEQSLGFVELADAHRGFSGSERERRRVDGARDSLAQLLVGAEGQLVVAGISRDHAERPERPQRRRFVGERELRELADLVGAALPGGQPRGEHGVGGRFVAIEQPNQGRGDGFELFGAPVPDVGVLEAAERPEVGGIDLENGILPEQSAGGVSAGAVQLAQALVRSRTARSDPSKPWLRRAIARPERRRPIRREPSVRR